MLIWTAPTWEKYSQTFLKIFIFRPPRTFFPKPSQTHPKTSPDHSQTHPKTSKISRKNGPDPTKSVPDPTNKNVPKHVPTYVKINENNLPTCPKKVTCARRESNRAPPDAKSKDLPTRLFRPQNIASLKILYASKIRGVCVCAPAGAFPSPK